MPVATTRLPQEISDYLAARAKVTGESVSDLLRQAVEQWVKEQDPEELLRVQRELNRERELAMQHFIEQSQRVSGHAPKPPATATTAARG
jgi:predicted DNA-binding protein